MTTRMKTRVKIIGALVWEAISIGLIWGVWNWFGAAALNAAMPGLQAQAVDGWAVLGILTMHGVYRARAAISKVWEDA